MKGNVMTAKNDAAQPALIDGQAPKVKSITIRPSAELYARIEEYRWANRVNKIHEVVLTAVEAFLAAESE